MRGTNRTKLWVAAIACASLVVPAVSLSAQAAPVRGLGACGDTSEIEQPFLRWGDAERYTLVPDGTFEDGTGWNLEGGARVVAGNEPNFVHGPGERSSLLLPPGASATSPALCIALKYPTLRLFTRSSKGGILRFEVLWLDGAGVLRSSQFMRLPGRSSWTLTPALLFLINAAVPVQRDGTMVVGFRLTAEKGAWQVDDVYVDPRVGH